MRDGRHDATPQVLPQPEDFIRYEEGDMSPDEVRAFFQVLIDSGTAWRLQGSYGRTAADLIARGICTPRSDATPAHRTTGVNPR